LIQPKSNRPTAKKIALLFGVTSMNHEAYTDQYLKAILDEVGTIAMVGASATWNRPSYFAMK
jgi:hypothetical protein